VGREAGENNQGVSAVAVGYQAGETTQGTNSVAIGNKAGQTNQGDASVAIGYQAGSLDTADNKLHIANNSSESLIEGDFGAREVTINGDLDVEDLSIGGDSIVSYVDISGDVALADAPSGGDETVTAPTSALAQKIGSMVVITVEYDAINNAGLSGIIHLTGLPYNAIADSTGSVRVGVASIIGAEGGIACVITSGTNYLTIDKTHSVGTTTQLAWSSTNSLQTHLLYQITYFTDD
jgi:hypothetical protein